MLDEEDEEDLIPASRTQRGTVAMALARGGLFYAGIDPGLHGFIAIVSNDATRVIETHSTPVFTDSATGSPTGYDERGMWELAHSLKGRVALVLLEEQAVTRPPQWGSAGGAMHNSMVSNFTKGVGFGLWRMALTAAGVPREEKLPVQWKGLIGVKVPPTKGGSKLKDAELKAHLDRRRKQGKEVACAKVTALFPTLDLRRNERCRTPDDNKAEAVLMAVVARRLHGGHAD